MKGRLIVIESIDGGGTETQSKKLLNYLKKKEIPAERIRYPDYSRPIGRLIHEYLHKKFDFPPDVQAMLYAADMVKDRDKINKWLEAGRLVIADRYITSTIAYQGFRGFPVEKIIRFTELFSLPKPEVIIYLKVSAKTSIERKLKEKPELDRNEADEEFLEKLVRFYMKLAKKNIFCKWVVVDGEKSRDDVFEEIRKILKL